MTLHVLLFMIFLSVSCDKSPKEVTVSNNVTAKYTITTTPLNTPHQPDDKGLENKTSNRISGDISKEKCAKYKQTSKLLVYGEKPHRTTHLLPHVVGVTIHNSTTERGNTIIKSNYSDSTNNTDNLADGITENTEGEEVVLPYSKENFETNEYDEYEYEYDEVGNNSSDRRSLYYPPETDEVQNETNSKNRYSQRPPENVYAIVGGNITAYQEFPHMALLGYQTNIRDKIEWRCGGSLISENFVLTAAHCVEGRTSPPKYVRVGITIQSNNSHLQERKVSEIITYPEYKRTDKYHDIALVRLEKGIEFTGKVYPACLHTEKYIPQKEAIATGWGFTNFVGSDSNYLMKVNLDLFTKENCTKKYEPQINSSMGYLKRGIDDEVMICAGSTEKIKNTCQGDSGGPLQVRHREKVPEGYTRLTLHNFYNIVGVTSFGVACGRVPGIFTRVSNYVKWIEDVVWSEK